MLMAYSAAHTDCGRWRTAKAAGVKLELAARLQSSTEPCRRASGPLADARDDIVSAQVGAFFRHALGPGVQEVAVLGEGVIHSPDTLRPVRIPPGQRQTIHWPVLHIGGVPRIDPSTWTLTLGGLVRTQRTITADEFWALPRVTVLSDFHCVTGWTRLDNLWEGVSTRTIMDLVEVLPEARHVVIHGAHGFATNLSLTDLLAEDVLLATHHDGRPLTAEHGGPVRLVVPRLYAWKSCKWIEGIDCVAESRPGFWESRGYHDRGDPWQEERYRR